MGILYASINNKIKENYSLLILFFIITVDLLSVDKKYVNEDDFVAKSSISNPFKENIFDLEIQKDKSDFRVFEPYRGLTNGRTSYFHKSISGYNAARPQKMQDLFDFYLFNKNYKVLDYPPQISSTYATEDGDPLFLDMPLPFVTNNIQAQRLAKIALAWRAPWGLARLRQARSHAD